MKYLIFVFTIVVLAFSCKKEKESQYQSSYNPSWGETSVYYFKGIIKDTTDGNSLVNYIVSPGSSSCISNKDTLIDSTYLIHYTYKTGTISCGLSFLDVVLYDTNRSVINLWNFPNPGWTPNDTIELNLYF